MKIVELNILKKNRLYFAATAIGGTPCRLKITEESANLQLGWHTLLVEDLSVVSKYGKDIIFSTVDGHKEHGVVTLKHHQYNAELVNACRNLGGKWDAHEEAWVFSDTVADAVENLDLLYNEDIVDVEITAKQGLRAYQASVYFAGYPVARAFGRDSGAKLGEGVALMTGTIRSGGSVKNWVTVVEVGSVFRLRVSKNLLAVLAPDDDDWGVVQL